MGELENKVERMMQLLEFSQELTSTIDLEPLLHKIVKGATDLTDCDLSSLMLFDEESGDLHFMVASSFEDQLVNISVPINGSIAGEAYASGKPVLVANASQDPRYYRRVGDIVGVSAQTLLAIPLQFQDRCIGVLEAENKRAETNFNQEDIETLTTLAAQATVAIENARLIEKLDQTRAVLEQRVDERTAALSTANEALKAENVGHMQTEARLRQHMLELEARNEDLDAFAHTVAHDLRNPLNIVNNLALLLNQGYDDLSAEKVSELLETIARSSRKMHQIIEALLLLAGVRNEPVELSPIDMGPIISEVKDRLMDMIEEDDALIVSPPHWPTAVGYAPWIEEVWVNYVSNALKYGGHPPRLELGAVQKSPGTITFWVRDNGDGVPLSKQEDIFRPFQRLNHIEVQGYGLGLSIVRKIIERLGGKVGVESSGAPGKGSTFYFTLPSHSE
ncbi:MAG: ATP-binding protein [Chloroflexota bacterium]